MSNNLQKEKISPEDSWMEIEKRYSRDDFSGMLPVIKLIKKWGYDRKFLASTSLMMLGVSHYHYSHDLEHDSLTVRTKLREGFGPFRPNPPKKDFRIEYRQYNNSEHKTVLSREFDQKDLEKNLKIFLEKLDREGK